MDALVPIFPVTVYIGLPSPSIDLARPIYDRLPSASQRYNKVKANQTESGAILIRKYSSSEACLLTEEKINSGTISYSNGNTYKIPDHEFKLNLPYGTFWAFIAENLPDSYVPKFQIALESTLQLSVDDQDFPPQNLILAFDTIAKISRLQENNFPIAMISKITRKPAGYTFQDQRVVIQSGNEPVAEWLTRPFDQLLSDAKQKADSLFSNFLDPISAPLYSDYLMAFQGLFLKWSPLFSARWKDVLANAWLPKQSPIVNRYDWAWNFDLSANQISLATTYETPSLSWASLEWELVDTQNSYFIYQSDVDLSLPFDLPENSFVFLKNGNPDIRLAENFNGTTNSFNNWLGITRAPSSLTTLTFLLDTFNFWAMDDAHFDPPADPTLAHQAILNSPVRNPLRPWMPTPFVLDESRLDVDALGPIRNQSFFLRLPLNFPRKGLHWALANHLIQKFTYFGEPQPANSVVYAKSDISKCDMDQVIALQSIVVNLQADKSTVNSRIADIVPITNPSDSLPCYAYLTCDYSHSDEPVFDPHYPFHYKLLTLKPIKIDFEEIPDPLLALPEANRNCKPVDEATLDCIITEESSSVNVRIPTTCGPTDIGTLDCILTDEFLADEVVLPFLGLDLSSTNSILPGTPDSQALDIPLLDPEDENPGLYFNPPEDTSK